MPSIRLELPAPLLRHARIEGRHEVLLEVPGAVTLRSALDALEAAYPSLRGTIRDPVTLHRRPFIRFFACGEDISHTSPNGELPAPVRSAEEPLLVVGAIAGG